MRGIRRLAVCLAAACVLGRAGCGVRTRGSAGIPTQNKKTGVWEPLAKKVAYTETTGTVSIGGAASDLTCTASTGKGKLTGPKTFTVKTVYTGCEDTMAGVTCQSAKKPGVIKLPMQEGTLVSAGAGFGVPTVPALSTPAIGSYSCGSAKLTMTGSLLGGVTPTNEPTEEATGQLRGRPRAGTGLRDAGAAAGRRPGPMRPLHRPEHGRRDRRTGCGPRRQRKTLQRPHHALEVS